MSRRRWSPATAGRRPRTAEPAERGRRRWPRTTIETGKVDETVGRTPDQPQPHAAAGSLPLAPRHVFLIDGSGFIFRAYHARHGAPPLRRKSDGMPTEVVTLFSNMLDKLRRETDADHIAVIFDASGTSFRNRIYEQYKAHRPPPPEDLIPQFAHVRQAAEAFNICQIEMEGFEADDLIATYARHAVAAGAEVTIVSSDKDLMQLVGAHVRMLDPITYRMIGEAEVREKFGVGPDKVVDVQALCGDSVDNVPGVPGIGVKAAAGADRARKTGAAVEGAGQARRPCAAALPAVGARRQALRSREAVPLSRRDGIAGAEDAHRAAPFGAGGGAAGGAGHPRDAPLLGAAPL